MKIMFLSALRNLLKNHIHKHISTHFDLDKCKRTEWTEWYLTNSK